MLSLATHPALSGLLSLQPGGVYAVDVPSLAFLLLAGPSAEGAWCAIVGSDRVGVEAAAEAGVALERTVWIPDAGADSVAIVMVDRVRLPDREAGRLRARLHQRQAALVAVGDWPRADARLRWQDPVWSGPDAGHGHLVSRQVTVVVERGGRVTGSRRLWFPSAEIDVSPVFDDVPLAQQQPQRGIERQAAG